MGDLRPVVCGCFAFFIIESAIFLNHGLMAGEPLQVSGQTNKVMVPRAGSSGSVASPAANFFKRDSSAPAFFDDAPVISPSKEGASRNRRVQELVDRQQRLGRSRAVERPPLAVGQQRVRLALDEPALARWEPGVLPLADQSKASSR